MHLKALGFVVAALVATACSDDTTQTQLDAAVADASADATQPDLLSPDASVADAAPDGPTNVTLSLSFSDLLTKAYVDGVQVCVQEDSTIPCATTGNSALTPALLTVSGDKDLTLIATKTGYITRVLYYSKDSSNTSFGYTFFPSSVEATINTNLGATIDLKTQGALIATPLLGMGHQEDATVTITPAAGLGPHYAGKDGLPDKTLTATGTPAWTFFFNLPPGDYTVSAKNKAGKPCNVQMGLQGATPDLAKVTIQKAVMSALSFSCP